MPKKKRFWEKLKIDVRVGTFLANRDLKRANIWTTILITFVMLFTFLNLVVVSGILVGLIEGSLQQNKQYSTGDLIVSSFLNRDHIDHSQDVIKVVGTTPGLVAYSARYTGGGTVDAGYHDTLLKNEQANTVGANVAGVDPEHEDAVTHISRLMVEGNYLEENDTGGIIIGSSLLRKYNANEFPGFTTLKDVAVGDRVLMKMGENQKEFVIRGILKSKVGEVDTRVFMLDSEFRKLSGRSDFNVNEIAIKLTAGTDPILARQALVAGGVGEYGRVQTSDEAVPQFLDQIKTTFGLLGNAISAIGLVVAAITIFIVIFVNAITRRRYIGILKGIGITPRAITISYIAQSIFYAVIGAGLGALLVFSFLKPFFDVHPINFPFSDGILVATVSGTAIRTVILLIATIVAGYVPARMVVRQNTLDAILGR